MALKRGAFSTQEVEYIEKSREQGVDTLKISKQLNRSESSVIKNIAKRSKTIALKDKELNSVTLSVLGVEITMLFK